MCHKNK